MNGSSVAGEEARSLVVATGSRLHFGLFGFGRPGVPQYGGVGLMLDSPSTVVRLEQAAEFQAVGPCCARVAAVTEGWRRYAGEAEMPRCRIAVLVHPPQHVGLGSGTQLACAVASGLARWRGRPIESAADLAAASGRGQRSAIGTHGFLHGGLLVDGGKLNHESLGELAARRSFPPEWRVVLMWPGELPESAAYTGERERVAFERLPAVPAQREQELREMTFQQLLPALKARQFETFAQGVQQYNRLAGECYRSVQGGPYASAAVSELIETLSNWGVQGIGQSSWGPLVFALASSLEEAEAIEQRVAAAYPAKQLRSHIASAATQGAVHAERP